MCNNICKNEYVHIHTCVSIFISVSISIYHLSISSFQLLSIFYMTGDFYVYSFLLEKEGFYIFEVLEIEVSL